jgi:cystathionine beta-synthase
MLAPMQVYESILDVVGDTPLVRLARLGSGLAPELLAKVEYLNPGGSVKDRIGLAMVERAERAGLLKPGGTIVEPTSGNTGAGLAIVAALKGYRCVFVMPDKMSQEKIALLRGYGAEVVIAPTAVPPDSPESYYSVANRLTAEIPGAFQPNQYTNPANPEAHYRTTGPELWRQTDGAVDVLVAGIGTGGTISGTGRYLKERKPGMEVVGADPEGSIYTSKDVHPYLVEGVGEDFWPETFDPSVVDRYVTVSDRDAFLMTRRLAREEGLLVGGSCGMAMVAPRSTAATPPSWCCCPTRVAATSPRSTTTTGCATTGSCPAAGPPPWSTCSAARPTTTPRRCSRSPPTSGSRRRSTCCTATR